MIKHIVFIKLKGVSDDEKNDGLNKLKTALDNLPSQISEIKKFETGINISDASTASDFVLIGEFESKETLEAYKSHPEHQKVLELISSLKGRTAVVDFEF
ncbi:MAG: Dabb family protein [Bacteroidales bacterium]|nr:Dabb family protein [Bacteroidales bacterium]